VWSYDFVNAWTHETRIEIESYRHDYKHFRPHSSLGTDLRYPWRCSPRSIERDRAVEPPPHAASGQMA
jgi:hypothetical protein